MSVQNIGACFRDRPPNKARAERLDDHLLLARYALEHMLYRLSILEQRDQFLLKGHCCSTCGSTFRIEVEDGILSDKVKLTSHNPLQISGGGLLPARCNQAFQVCLKK